MATKGMQIIQGYIKQVKNYENFLKRVQLISAGDGACVASLKVEDEHLNIMGSLHGGCSATLVDVVSSWALLTHEKGLVPSVSVNINLTYLKGAVKGDELLIESHTTKAGKTLAFLNVVIKNKETGEELVQGSHTKFLLNPK